MICPPGKSTIFYKRFNMMKIELVGKLDDFAGMPSTCFSNRPPGSLVATLEGRGRASSQTSTASATTSAQTSSAPTFTTGTKFNVVIQNRAQNQFPNQFFNL